LRHERAAVRERSLAAAGASLVAAADGAEVQAAALSAVSELLRDERFTRVSLSVYQDDGLVHLTSSGLDSAAVEGLTVDPRTIPAEYRVTSTRAQLIADTSTLAEVARHFGFTPHPGSVTATPLTSKDQPLGVLLVESPGRLSSESINAL